MPFIFERILINGLPTSTFSGFGILINCKIGNRYYKQGKGGRGKQTENQGPGQTGEYRVKGDRQGADGGRHGGKQNWTHSYDSFPLPRFCPIPSKTQMMRGHVMKNDEGSSLLLTFAPVVLFVSPILETISAEHWTL